jgi:hypothetical protein
VTLRFLAGPDVIDMGPGNVDIGIGVDEPTPQAIVVPTNFINLLENTSEILPVHLAAQPAGNVVVNVINPTPGLAVSATALVFTPSNYNVDQVIVLSALDDPDFQNIAGELTLQSSVASTTIQLAMMDDDFPPPPPILIATAALTMTEGNTTQLNVQLSSQPSSNITVAFASDNTSVVTVAPTMITFTPGNWNISQFVAVAATQDADVVNSSANIIATSTGLPTHNVAVTVLDDDVQTIISSAANLTILPGQTMQVAFHLAFQPSANLPVAFAVSDPGHVAVSPTVLTFTPANYAVSQIVTFTNVPDADNVTNNVIVTASSPGIPAVAISVIALE